MEKIILTILILLNTNIAIAKFYIANPCKKKLALKSNITSSMINKSVGEITIHFLDKNKVKYLGNENGIHSINGTKYGSDAIQVISDTEMNAYGWCFSINGKVPDKLAGQIKIKSTKDRILWFYAFSNYKDGKWTNYCVPSYKAQKNLGCSKNQD